MNICKKHKLQKNREPAGKLRCRLCNKEKGKGYRRRNPLYDHEFYLQTLANAMVHRARKRAVRKGVPFRLIASDIQLPSICPVLGIRLVPSVGSLNDASPTLDRIIPSRGYVVGNVQVISHKANRIKNDATLKEVQAVADYMRTIEVKGRL